MTNYIPDREKIISVINKIKSENKKVVFTNGCFDVLHAGHVDYLNKAKMLGDVLIVALNSDNSVRKIKGNKRPIVPLEQRAFIIANLKSVDFVTVFEEETPAKIISDLVPDFLVKGADWDVSKIVGRQVVENNGGEIKTIEFVNNVSTTKIIEVIVQRFCK